MGIKLRNMHVRPLPRSVHVYDRNGMVLRTKLVGSRDTWEA